MEEVVKDKIDSRRDEQQRPANTRDLVQAQKTQVVEEKNCAQDNQHSTPDGQPHLFLFFGIELWIDQPLAEQRLGRAIGVYDHEDIEGESRQPEDCRATVGDNGQGREHREMGRGLQVLLIVNGPTPGIRPKSAARLGE